MMTSPSRLSSRDDFGFARVKDAAYDAVSTLWRRRQIEGVTQKDLADRLGRDQGWVSRQFRGPGNWTFRTFGALVQALDGEVTITVDALEDPLPVPVNYDAYAVARQTDVNRTMADMWMHQSGGIHKVLEPSA